jgi:hypothetical protein
LRKAFGLDMQYAKGRVVDLITIFLAMNKDVVKSFIIIIGIIYL